MSKTRFLPQGLKERAAKAVRAFWGLAFLGLASWTLIALISYDSFDPSWNLSMDGISRNWAGLPGSYFADTTMQLFGMAIYSVPLLLVSWSFLILNRRPFIYPFIRGGSALLVLPLASIALGAKAEGGLFGTFVFSKLSALLGVLGPKPLTSMPFDILFWSLTLLGGGLLIFASGLHLKDLWHLSQKGWQGIRVVSFLVRRLIFLCGAYLAKLFLGTRSGLVASQKRPVEELSPETNGIPSSSSGVASSPRIERERPSGPSMASPDSETSPDEEDTRPFWRGSKKKARGQEATLKDTVVDLSQLSHEYQLPSMAFLLKPVTCQETAQSDRDLEARARQLADVLDDYGVRGDITRACPGPVVTLYELTPAPGVKSSRVTGLADDIARSMSALSARVSVIPGQNALGIELPNTTRQTVFLRELLSERHFENTVSKLALALGKDISGRAVTADLARMPHLLVAGTTGSGKSVAINTMILSLLYRLPPEKCRFLMIDPKMLELSVYNDIPHLLAPVVTDPKKAIVALKWAVREMEDRYRAMSRMGVRNIEGYNARLTEAKRRGEQLTRQVHTGFAPETGKPIYETQPLDMTLLPYIVVIVDEMADLMMVAGKEIEAAVQRLAQMARAAGIHLIMATQRPSVDVITGTIKANFPTRISFQVTSKFDSRTILGEQGAEQLLGRGDMLYMEAGGRTQRIHGPLVSDEEVERVVAFLKEQGVPDYIDGITDESADTPLDSFGESGPSDGDSLYQQAVALVLREQKASTSFIQRHLQIGYNRAARLIEQMEAEGIISTANHVGKREVLMKEAV